ncbi:odorant receptor 13a-like [Vespula maculifrons]|uniref:Odorant receptor 13a-like n=1 Tax=Vespula maculifrons TaxID=7453 RepID=A0ABD2BPP3_VESMC
MDSTSNSYRSLPSIKDRQKFKTDNVSLKMMMIYEVEKMEKVLMTHHAKLFNDDDNEDVDDVFITGGSPINHIETSFSHAYCTCVLMRVINVFSNSSYGYQLPYIVWLLMGSNDLIAHNCLFCYQFIIIPSIVFDYVDTDYLFVNRLFYALSCKVKRVLNDPYDQQCRTKDLIVKQLRYN